MKNLTMKILLGEWCHWWCNESEVRFGQYMCNKHNEEWPELFYQEDHYKAFDMLMEQI